MSAAREEALSPDELRKRLYQTFKNRGVLDTLKTQLRNQLIQELKHPHVSRGDTVPRLVSLKSDCLLVSACNSLVADHLRTSGYEYTLSVFYPESGLSKDKVFTTGDLLQLMKISPESTLYRSLTVNKQKDRKGFLISLLTELTGYYTHGVCCDADTQTTTSPTYRGSLVEKMKMIDQEYDSLHSRGDQWVSYESKLAGYRKDIDAQMHAEINTKMQHFKDVEIATVKMEEKAKSRKEFEQLRRDMERTYEMKAEALIKREKNAIERLQKQQEIEEKGIYMQRQELLKEIETVRNRENELKMRMESFEKTCQIHKEKIKTTEELLRRRELTVKTLEDTYDQNLKNELSRYQRELDEGFVKRTQKLTENETINNVETARIQKESAAVNAKIEEHNKACSELRRLQIELDTSQQQASLLSQQKELLRDRLETMKDYPSLKREKVELQGQLRLLKKQLEEVQEENRLFRGDLGKPSVEQLALQTELRRLQNARRLDEEEFDNQRQVLQAQFQSEVERCAQLKAQLIECEERAQWMNTHAQETKMQLSQTQQALEREVLRNPKPSLVDRSILELSADKLLPPDIYVDRALLKGRVGHDDDDGVCEAAGGPMRWRRSHPARTDSPDSDSEWLAGAKSRIRELERESDNLEEVYRNYQQRALHSMRPHSPQQVHPIPFSHRTRPRSPQRPQVSSRPLSPQHLYTVTSCPAPQQKVTFFAEQQQISGSPSSAEPRFRADGCPREDGSSPSRRLSSTPRSLSSKQLQTELIEVAVSPVPFPDLSPERHPSPAPRGGVVSSGDSSADLSPPRSPQLKSTARDQRSPQKVQRVSSSTESSPQPEKISLQDLTETLPEPSRIPEPLLDTAIPLSEEPPDGPAVAPLQAPRDLPDTQIHTQKHGGVVEGQQRPGEPSAPQEDEEDEELRWERERRERQDRRQREIEEAKEWELRELERLEKETAFEEVVQCGLGVEEEAKERGRHEEEEDKKDEETGGQKSSGGDPLEKYMKLVLEAREKQHAQSPGQEEPQHMSPDFKSLSEEKDDSIAVYSHEAVDDDFW